MKDLVEQLRAVELGTGALLGATEAQLFRRLKDTQKDGVNLTDPIGRAQKTTVVRLVEVRRRRGCEAVPGDGTTTRTDGVRGSTTGSEGRVSGNG